MASEVHIRSRFVPALVLAAVVGVGFSRGLYKMEDLWDRIPLHDAAKPILGGALVGTLALAFPHVMGVGYESIGAALESHADFGMVLLLGLVLAKILATHLTIGSGLSGGIFAPSLFIGTIPIQKYLSREIPIICSPGQCVGIVPFS